MNKVQLIDVHHKIEDEIEARAKRNQVAAGGAVPQKSVKPIDTQKELAKIAGVSHGTYEKATKVLDTAPEPITDALFCVRDTHRVNPPPPP